VVLAASRPVVGVAPCPLRAIRDQRTDPVVGVRHSAATFAAEWPTLFWPSLCRISAQAV
jgi:hypothetical protein